MGEKIYCFLLWQEFFNAQLSHPHPQEWLPSDADFFSLIIMLNIIAISIKEVIIVPIFSII